MREILWLAIALLGVYVAVQLYLVLRMGAVRNRTAGVAHAAGDDMDTVRDDAAGDTAVYGRPRPVSTGSGSDAFQLELEVQQLRRDVAQLRAELDAQRKDFADLATKLRAQQEQFDADLAVKGGSPEYNEALVFARRGLDVEAIAERCGITVAEAALVRALAQGGPPAPEPRP